MFHGKICVFFLFLKTVWKTNLRVWDCKFSAWVAVICDWVEKSRATFSPNLSLDCLFPCLKTWPRTIWAIFDFCTWKFFHKWRKPFRAGGKRFQLLPCTETAAVRSSYKASQDWLRKQTTVTMASASSNEIRGSRGLRYTTAQDCWQEGLNWGTSITLLAL